MAGSYSRTGLLSDESITPTRIRVSSHGRDTDRQIVIDSTAEDDSSTTLRKGLVLGQITASGKFAQYDDGASDGTEVAKLVLADEVNMLCGSSDGATPEDQHAVGIEHGVLIEDRLYGLDANGKADLTHIIFR